jgi:hypothetical protein
MCEGEKSSPPIRFELQVKCSRQYPPRKSHLPLKKPVVCAGFAFRAAIGEISLVQLAKKGGQVKSIPGVNFTIET